MGVMESLRVVYTGGDLSIPVPYYVVALFGAIAGAASVLGNTPIDVIKTRMQGLDAHLYKNTWHCTTELYRTDGFAGFYKGTMARMSRVVADVAIVFMLFDWLKPKVSK